MEQAPQESGHETAERGRRFERINGWLTLAANLGVIAGLLILAWEIQQNTSIARASAYRDHVQDIAAWREMTIVNPELSRIYGTYLRDGTVALEGDERSRLVGMVNNLIGSYENAWFAWRYGVLDDEQWQRFHAGACIHFRIARERELDLRFVTAPYRDHLAQHCRDTE